MTMKTLTRALLAAAALAGAAGGAVAQQATLRASHWIPATAQPAPVWEEWFRSMERASNGTLRIQIFPAGQLGRANDHYDMARDGIADFAWAVPGFNAGRFPIFAASELPMLVGKAPEAVNVFDTWYRRHVAREMGDVHYCIAHMAPVSTLNFTSRQIQSPEDMRGVRIRPQSATMGRFFASLGASVVQVSAAEARQAFDRGLIDGIAFPWRTLFSFNLQNSARMNMDMPLSTAPSVWVMNRARYNALPPAAKAAVDSHCTPDWAQRIVGQWDAWEGEGRAQLTANGNTIYPVAASTVAAWRSAANAFHGEWVREATKPDFNAQVELDRLKAELSARNAGM